MKKRLFLFIPLLLSLLLNGSILQHRRLHFRYWTANNETLSALEPYIKFAFPLGEASGNRVDLINGYTAAPTNDQGNVAGKYGNALNCNASGYLTLPNATYDAAGDLTGSFLFTAWFKTSGSAQCVIFECAGAAWGGTGNGGFALWRRNDSGNVINARLYNSSGSSIANVTSAGAYNDGNWHHVAVVYNASAPSLSLYVDNNKTSTVPSAAVGDNGNNARFGADGSGTSVWDGALDEPYFFSGVIATDADISALYNSDTGSFRME